MTICYPLLLFILPHWHHLLTSSVLHIHRLSGPTLSQFSVLCGVVPSCEVGSLSAVNFHLSSPTPLHGSGLSSFSLPSTGTVISDSISGQDKFTTLRFGCLSYSSFPLLVTSVFLWISSYTVILPACAPLPKWWKVQQRLYGGMLAATKVNRKHLSTAFRIVS